MKIIKEGNKEHITPEWWEGQTLTCSCGCICKTEKDDLVNIHSERRPNGKQTAFFKCPTCNGSLTYIKPRIGGWGMAR